jgi:peptidoglycan/LPS O-acetylase OafA/YrhL
LRADPNTTPPSTPKTRQVIGLDVIRFSAALLVVAFHFGFWTNVENASSHGFKFTSLQPYFCHGFVGVDIFFVLSGIVIAYSAERSTALSFLKSRILRLYPAVWICSTMTLLILLYGPASPWPSLHLWLNSIVLSPFGPWIDPSYWTLGIEMSFYSLLFFLLLGKSFRYLAPLMILVGLLSSAALAYSYLAQRTQSVSGSLSGRFLTLFTSRLAYLLLLRHGPLFAFGVFLWLCFYHGFTLPRIIALATFFAGSMLAVHAEWAAIAAIAIGSFPSTPSLLLWLVAIVAIVLSLAYNRQIARAVGPRGATLARAAGLATYPLYLIHQQFGDILIHHLYPRMPYPAAMALCVALLLTFSFAVVPYVERPLRNYLKGVLHVPWRTAQPSASLP